MISLFEPNLLLCLSLFEVITIILYSLVVFIIYYLLFYYISLVVFDSSTVITFLMSTEEIKQLFEVISAKFEILLEKFESLEKKNQVLEAAQSVIELRIEDLQQVTPVDEKPSEMDSSLPALSEEPKPLEPNAISLIQQHIEIRIPEYNSLIFCDTQIPVPENYDTIEVISDVPFDPGISISVPLLPWPPPYRTVRAKSIEFNPSCLDSAG